MCYYLLAVYYVENQEATGSEHKVSGRMETGVILDQLPKSMMIHLATLQMMPGIAWEGKDCIKKVCCHDCFIPLVHSSLKHYNALMFYSSSIQSTDIT